MRNLALHLASILATNGLLSEIDGPAVDELQALCLDCEATMLFDLLADIRTDRSDGGYDAQE